VNLDGKVKDRERRLVCVLMVSQELLFTFQQIFVVFFHPKSEKGVKVAGILGNFSWGDN
jgi:hypothetical protein